MKNLLTTISFNTTVQRQESFSPTGYADIGDDGVTAKRNDMRQLASFSVFTNIEYCKMTFISKLLD